MLLSHLECLGLRVNFAKSVLYPSQRISFLGTVIDSNEGGGHTRTCTGHSATQGFIQTWSPSPPQRISKDAGTHGLSVFGKSVGPASHAAPWALAETSSSSTRLASRTPPSQGELGLHCSSGPLEEPSVDGMGRAPKHGLQKEWGLDKRRALCDGKPAFGLYSKKEGHINCLEMPAACLGLRTFLPDLRGHPVLVCSDSMRVVSCINRQGDLKKAIFKALKKGFSIREKGVFPSVFNTVLVPYLRIPRLS